MIVALFFYLLSLVCWIGAIVFFSFFTAPVIFTRLPVAEAGKVVGAIFPLYYALGYVAGPLSIALASYFAAVRTARAWWVGSAVLLGISLVLTLYAGMVVRPKVQLVRSVVEETNPDPATKAQFDSLHRLSVQLNGAVLVLNLLALASSAAALSSNAQT
jgi:hypothetical protein